jgi:DNA-binding response OmpR family regulator
VTQAPRRDGGEPSDTVLVVEDDTLLRKGLAMNLRMQGYRVLTASDGNDGLRKSFEARPDLIVLDLMLPGIGGLEIVAELRRHGQEVPVLILSARGTTKDKIEGLGVGADDYVAKPFDLAELLARVAARLRHRRAAQRAEPPIRFGPVVVEPGGRRVTCNGKSLALSAKEFDILCLLARAPGRVFSRQQILDSVWGFGFEGTPRTVDNYLRSLRTKIEKSPSRPRYIKTVRQVGYKLETA